MIQRIIIIVTIVMLALIAQAQEYKTQTRTVRNITAVKVGSGIDLYLRQGNAEKLQITAADDRIDKIVTEVRDGVLHIYFENNNWNWNWGWSNRKSPEARLVFKDLRSISAGGGSDVTSDERLLFDEIKLNAGGGSDIKLELNAELVEANAGGGSDIVLSGNAKYLKANASGGSDFKGKDLRSKYCKVNVSGGSDAFVWVESELTANASGGSDVHYYGNPEQVKKSTSGGSDVNKR